MTTPEVEKDHIRQIVRQRYGSLVEPGPVTGSCCSTACCESTANTPDDRDQAREYAQKLGYSAADLAAAPAGAEMGLGCGNPQAIAALKPGEVVVDLGSGAGFDCFLAARQVGPEGRVIGVDMTPAMLSKARANAAAGNFDNVEFRLGEIENLPVADNAVDVLISNCVINLSPDKQRVFNEAWRILKPGGRIAVSDVVAFAEPPEEVRRNMSLYSCCVAGAALVGDVEAMLHTAGFSNVRVTPNDTSKSFMRDWASDIDVTQYMVSAGIEAVKPEDISGK